MMLLPPDFKEFLKLLNLSKVEYLLIGGYAVAYHGYPRATGDMDIWIAIAPKNAEKVVEVLRKKIWVLSIFDFAAKQIAS